MAIFCKQPHPARPILAGGHTVRDNSLRRWPPPPQPDLQPMDRESALRRLSLPLQSSPEQVERALAEWVGRLNGKSVKRRLKT